MAIGFIYLGLKKPLLELQELVEDVEAHAQLGKTNSKSEMSSAANAIFC